MPNPFRYFHSSPEVIHLAVMMYVRFPLSPRNVEDLLCERDIDICFGTVRLWWNRFGRLFAADMPTNAWISASRRHLDEMHVQLNGEIAHLRRTVDHEGEVLKSYVTKKRDKSAALRFMKKALKRHGQADKIITDGLRPNSAAMKDMGNLERRKMGRYLFDRQTFQLRRSTAMAEWQNLMA